MINFWRTTDEYGCLSNFSKHAINVDGVVYDTVEHYYQAMKSDDPTVQEYVRTASTPKESKKRAYEKPAKEGWDTLKFDVMRKALRCKVSQHNDVAKKLMKTYPQELAEASPYDCIWGTGKDGKGQNCLGKMWMEIRDEIRLEQKYIDPSL